MDQLPRHQLRNLATALGIGIEGKSSEELGVLIEEAISKPRARLASSIIDPDALSKHFEEGRFTDCTIRVKIKDASDDAPSGRPAKRPRSGRAKATEAKGPADGEHGVHVIKAHAVILASRSAYFERAMGGEWRESENRAFEVEVADETEYVTFRRLIKLCYGTTFIQEGDRDLDFSELVALIHVANAFECLDAVKQCGMALQEVELDWQKALQCIEMTDILKGVEGMADLAKKASYAIAKEVGPVDELFTLAKESEDGGDVLGGLRLSEKVKELPPAMFEALLSSKRLQLKTENEAFWLLLSWVEAQSEQSEEGKQELFTRMAKGLRFHDMDPGYILLMVSEHPRVIAAGLQAYALKESLIRANLARRTSAQVDGYHHSNEPSSFQGKSRSSREAKWIFDVRFNAAEASAIEPGEWYRKVVGLAGGMPWCIELDRGKPAGGEAAQAGVYTNGSLPFQWMTYNDGKGFYFRHKLEVGLGAARTYVDEEGNATCWAGGDGWGGRFAPWDDVFREGSEWLAEGELRVRVAVQTIKDQGPVISMDAQEEDEEEGEDEEEEEEEEEEEDDEGEEEE